MAVHEIAGHPTDMRYDAGLVALKHRAADGSWRDLLAPRPLTTEPGSLQTAGPTLVARRRRPVGVYTPRARGSITTRSLSVASDTLTLTPRLRLGGRTPRAAAASYRLIDGGVRVTIRGVRRGDRYRLLAFATHGLAQFSRRSIRADGGVWRFPVPIRVRATVGRYHSGPVENLDLLEINLRARSRKPLRYTITAG
jgi:hypothetical protein